MSRVFVTQENSNLDYRGANRFGEVVFLTNKEFSMQKHSLTNMEILDTIFDKMTKDFDVINDILMLTGNPIVMGYAFHLAMTKSRGVGFNLLKWSNQYREYHLCEFRVEENK